jgi:predicted DNA-binding transcriptional regulator AlpA
VIQFDQFPKTGLVRVKDILAPRGPLPISKSAWWAGVRSGRYPRPVKLGPRLTAWRAEDIWRLIEQGALVTVAR